MFGLYCNYIKNNNIIFKGMTERDFELFSLRAPMYGLSYIGFGLYPCLIVGVVAVPIMFISEIKLIKKNKGGD